MLTHAILAAGRGTRMFGPAGGNKAMAPVDGGYLIDYVVREVERLNPVQTRVLVPERDVSIAARLRALTASPVSAIPSPSDGTGPGVRRLLAGASTEAIALMTCDLVAPEGALSTFLTEAEPIVAVEEARCVVATSAADPHDPTPIFVHASGGVVTSYGKGVAASPSVFAGARLMNVAFQRLLLASAPNLSTDTQMMAAIVAAYPAAVRHLNTPGLFDVDDRRALGRAVLVTKGDLVD